MAAAEAKTRENENALPEAEYFPTSIPFSFAFHRKSLFEILILHEGILALIEA